MANTLAVSQSSSAFALGWLLEELYQPFPDSSHRDNHLSTIAELDRDDRIQVAFSEVDALLAALKSSGPSSADLRTAWKNDPRTIALRTPLDALNLSIFEQLTGSPSEVAAYQLGRALRDTCRQPRSLDEKTHGEQDKKAATRKWFLHGFGRFRLARLRRWLAQAGPDLPADAASTVAQSLQNWQVWAEANAPDLDKWDEAITSALENQGDHWRALLAGESGAPESGIENDAELDAWIQATGATSRLYRRLLLQVIRHFWLLLVVIVVIVGALIFLANYRGSGTTRVWGTIVTAAGGLGITATSLRTGASKVLSTVEEQVLNTARTQARAWQATLLPIITPSRAARRQLKKAGVDLPRRLENLT